MTTKRSEMGNARMKHLEWMKASGRGGVGTVITLTLTFDQILLNCSTRVNESRHDSDESTDHLVTYCLEAPPGTTNKQTNNLQLSIGEVKNAICDKTRPALNRFSVDRSVGWEHSVIWSSSCYSQLILLRSFKKRITWPKLRKAERLITTYCSESLKMGAPKAIKDPIESAHRSDS